MLVSANELGFRRSVSVTLRACRLHGTTRYSMGLEIRQGVDPEYQDCALGGARLKRVVYIQPKANQVVS